MAILARTGKGRSRPSAGPEGRMPLADHLRELRTRLGIAMAAIAVGFVAGWIYYGRLSDLLLQPYDSVVRTLAKQQGIDSRAVITGVAAPFMLQAKVALVAGIAFSCPVWLYELWAFIVPGLHRHEKKWTLAFVAIAGPLFLSGIALGYVILPKGLQVLIGFTPHNVTGLVDLAGYLSFVLRILLVFGVAFEIPLFVVLLNLAGVVRAAQLSRWRSWIVFGTFVFAAVATPSTDPITMLLLALPMTGLFLISEVIARVVDRRRAGGDDYAAYADDEASPLT